MQPIILTFIQTQDQFEYVDNIIETAIQQFSTMGIKPIIYVCTKLNYKNKYEKVFIERSEPPISVILRDNPYGYIIRQFANTAVRPHIYQWIHSEMLKGMKAILFHWANPIHSTNCWRVDFFVTKNENYYPNRGTNSEHDCAEVAWGKYIVEHSLFDFLKSHNSNENKFYIIPSKPFFIPQLSTVKQDGVKILDNIEIKNNIKIEPIEKTNFWKNIKRWLLWQK